MTIRMKRFCREYPVDWNATQAAIRAGYAPHAANRRAYVLINDPAVVAEIQKHVHVLNHKADVTVERVLTELARIAFADITAAIQIRNGRVRVVDTDSLTSDQRSAIAEIAETEGGIRVRTHSKDRALEQLAKHLGMFIDRTEHSGGLKLEHALSDADLERIAAGGGAGAPSAPSSTADAAGVPGVRVVDAGASPDRPAHASDSSGA